jgi:hypothetical protein
VLFVGVSNSLDSAQCDTAVAVQVQHPARIIFVGDRSPRHGRRALHQYDSPIHAKRTCSELSSRHTGHCTPQISSDDCTRSVVDRGLTGSCAAGFRSRCLPIRTGASQVIIREDFSSSFAALVIRGVRKAHVTSVGDCVICAQ